MAQFLACASGCSSWTGLGLCGWIYAAWPCAARSVGCKNCDVKNCLRVGRAWGKRGIATLVFCVGFSIFVVVELLNNIAAGLISDAIKFGLGFMLAQLLKKIHS